jgi:hypothetical protein
MSQITLSCPYCSRPELKGQTGLSVHLARNQHCKEAQEKMALIRFQASNRPASRNVLLYALTHFVHIDYSINPGSFTVPDHDRFREALWLAMNMCQTLKDLDQTMRHLIPWISTKILVSVQAIILVVKSSLHVSVNLAVLAPAPLPAENQTEPRLAFSDPEDEEYILRSDPAAAATFGDRMETRWHKYKTQMCFDARNPFAPWKSIHEFQLVEWLILAKLSRRSIDDFLQLPIVSYATSIPLNLLTHNLHVDMHPFPLFYYSTKDV